MNDRGKRRLAAELAKIRARRHIKTRGDRSAELADDPRFVGKHAVTPHPCSCTMGCGNRRACEGPTRQERRADSANAGLTDRV